MKTKFLIILLGILYAITMRSQYYTGTSQINPSGTFMDPLYLCTGTNANATAAQAVNSNDYRWENGSGSTWNPAYVVPVASSCFWTTPPSFPKSNWITVTNGFGCSANGYDRTCVSGFLTNDYRIRFSLPTYTFAGSPSPSYYIDWMLFANDRVTDIWVNSTHVVSNNGYGNQNLGFPFKCCTGWKQGINTIVVRTVTSSTSTCSGLLVLSSPVPIPTISGPTLACPNSTNTYVTTLPFNTGSMVTWARPVGFSAPPQPAAVNGTAVMVAGQNSGLVQIAITNTTTGTCVGAAQITVTVPPPLNITASSPSVCMGSNVVLTASGGSSYTWYSPPGGPSPYSGNPFTTSPPNVGANTYTVKGLSTLGSCSYSKTVVVTGVANPTMVITASSPSICSGQCATLTASGSASSYTWYPMGTPGTGVVVCPNTTTSYLLVGKLNGCTGLATTTITVLPSPTVTAVANPVSICQGDSTVLTAAGASNYTWLPGSFTVNPVTVSPTVTTNYTVNGAAANTCTGSAVVTVSVLGLPTITVIPGFICSGITNTFIAGGGAPGSYVWTFGSPVNQTFSGPSTLTMNLSGPVSYTVCASSSNNSCTSCFTSSIGYGTTIPITAPNVTMCTNTGPCTTISVSSTLSPVNYTWQLTGGPTGPTVAVCPTSSLTTYSVSATSTAGCPSSATMQVQTQFSCCAQTNTPGLTLISGLTGTMANASFVMLQSQTLTSSTWLQNCEVLMAPAVKITVPAGMQLDLDRVHLFACGQYAWHGIQILDGGRVTTPAVSTRTSNSLIEDAGYAIEMDTITVTNSSPNPPIDIQRVIFNRNFYGIFLSNSDPALDSLAIGINGCIFSCRDYTYTTFPSSILSWPSSDITCLPLALKCATSLTTGLAPPYSMAPFPQSTLKNPWAGQPAHAGIRIEYIGNPNGTTPQPGIQWNYTYNYVTNDFNLFDGLGNGIDIYNASLTTYNNVFQNMIQFPYGSGTYGGYGIFDTIGWRMNARLNLKGTGNSDGNYFWDCIAGINAHNVYDFWVDDAIFRSTHNSTSGSATLPLLITPGDVGIIAETNRFDFTVKNAQFNNVRNGIMFSTPLVTDSFDIGSGATYGIYAKGLDIEENYFGPEVLSSNSIGLGDYMSDAILLSTPNTAGWTTSNQNSFIVSNKIHRAFRGISVDGMENSPLSIAGNSVYIYDDNIYNVPNLAFGWGIAVQNNQDTLAVQVNTLLAQNSITNSVSLVYCRNNYGTNSPRVECNSVSNSNIGFHFSGWNGGSLWQGNEMCANMIGLALTDTAIIGQQGISSTGNGNAWLPATSGCPLWGGPSALWQTFCDNSNPLQSPLYVVNSAPLYNPFPWANGFTGGYGPYQTITPQSLFPTATGNTSTNCVGNNPYLAVPWWRTASTGSVTSDLSDPELVEGSIQIYPNPTDGKLTIVCKSGEVGFKLRVTGLDGRVLYTGTVSGNTENTVDLAGLPPAVYILELTNKENKVIRKKLIKTN